MPEYTGRGFKIHYVEQGNGPAVVFAHGFLMDHTMFAPQFEDLPEHYRCIAWDMRGHGFSDCPPGPWSMQDTVVDMIHLIGDLNADPCHFVGMSWGGMIGVRIALQREDLLRSLVLIDTSADAEDPERVPLYESFRQQIAEEGLGDELVDATLPVFYGERFIADDPAGVGAHRVRAKEMPREALTNGLDALTTRSSVVDRLAEVRVPTLVVHGREDAAIPVAKAEETATGIPGAELLVVPGAGHTTPLEAPDEVNRVLADFLDRVR